MSTLRANIHPGWTKSEALEGNQKHKHTFHKSDGVLHYEAGPLEIWCGPNKVTEEEWRSIESWIKNVVPKPGHRMQVFFTICDCELSADRPVQLKLLDENRGFSKEQRDRVSLRRHNHHNQPVFIRIMLRQTVRPV